MKLLRLTLRNFKGAEYVLLDANGGDTSVYGDNGTGKTTIADGWFWLLFGKDSQNRKNFEIKTLDRDSLPVSGLSHSVEAVLDFNGERIVLEKVYREVWSQKRGSASKEFGGHTNDHKINSVPVQEKEFDARVAELCPENRFRLLSDPLFFNTQLKWEERRRILIEVCGDVTDADVVASNPALEDLPGILGSHKLDDYRKIVDARRKEINKELEGIPPRIDEVRRAAVNAPKGDPDEYEIQIAALRGTLRSLQERRAAAAAGGEIASKTKSLREVEGELIGVANRLRSTVDNGPRDQALAAVRAQDEAIAQARSEVSILTSRIRNAEGERARMEPRLNSLREDFARENGRGYAGADSCPACGQPLPADKVDAAKAEFNSQKSRRLEQIQQQGVSLRKDFDNLGTELEKLTASLAAANARLEELQRSRNAIVVPEANVVDPTADPEYRALLDDKARIEAEIAALKADASSAADSIDAEISSTQSRIQEAESVVARIRQKQDGEARVKELTAREKALTTTYEELTRHIFLIEEFIRTKVALLTSRINDRFAIARFKLFDEQVNGGLRECCEVMRDGVPYNSLNHGSRINVGLDIIDTLAAHYQFAPPIFIDNAESVTQLLMTRGQQIRLVVSADDPVLRIETSGGVATTPATAQEAMF
jgi:DNA repair exonuclease SbcCD ATPase subunit